MEHTDPKLQQEDSELLKHLQRFGSDNLEMILDLWAPSVIDRFCEARGIAQTTIVSVVIYISSLNTH